ncbi:MAG: hypothetical protein HYZ83_03190 [Candidatus Omnitrophica bacterium]|nr:hypothetical protein [Candidatus Omnitrophota bacterium]
MSVVSIDKILWVKSGEGIAAAGHIPLESEFFQDHFPDFPVLPGVLALEMLKQTAEAYLEKTSPGSQTHYFLKQIHATRFSTYLKPGDEWESHLKLIAEEGNQTRWSAELLHKGKIAVSAQLTMEGKIPILTQGGQI